jgi:nitrogenase molybdenum-iron protein alpha/beta subunit
MLKQTGLEYSVPARGGWTIVHVGMLVPEAHEIFVCAAGCLRGVVLSAAEMNLTDRFSTVAIEEHNVTDGDMEELLVEGVTDILNRLKKRPPCVLIYTSCIHHFMGTDLDDCFRALSERFPEVDFVDCYMTPTMRKSTLNPDKMMRKRLYAAIKPLKTDDRDVLLCGNCFAVSETSEIKTLIKKAGKRLLELPSVDNYSDYKKLGTAGLIISNLSVAKDAADELAEKLGVKSLQIPFSFGYEEIRDNLEKLAKEIGTTYDTFEADKARADEALRKAHDVIGNCEIAVDGMITTRPYSLARLLAEHGFNVSAVFSDSVGGEDTDYEWLKSNIPGIRFEKCVSPEMRTFSYKAKISGDSDGTCETKIVYDANNKSTAKVLALGQKAAYFTQTGYFVDMVENGPLYGFDGIVELSRMMTDAFLNVKDLKKTLDIKGWGCESCI